MTIVVAEDLLALREVLVKMLSSEFENCTIVEADTGVDSIRLCAQLQPNFLILDIILKDMHGAEVLGQLRKMASRTKVLIFSARTDDLSLSLSGHEFVCGFIDKGSCSLSSVVDALKSALSGHSYFSEGFESKRRARMREIRRVRALLTEWEVLVLSLIGLGLNDVEIGEKLEISPRTVQGHRSILIRKLNLRSTPKLMAFASRHGFTDAALIQYRDPSLY